MKGNSASTAGFWAASPWISRVLMLPPIFILAMIGLRLLGDPAGAVGEDMHLTLDTARAVTHMRVFGVFPAGYAVVLGFCWIAQERLRMGLSLVAFLMLTALVVRLYGISADGTLFQDEKRLVIAEIVFFGLAMAGVILETLRRRRVA